jgi:hypothetical protein
MANGNLSVELVSVKTLKDHPRNYRGHPEDQIAHLKESIERHGFYRNVVVAKDGTLLAGHGVVKAARAMGIAKIPVVRLDMGPEEPQALKILAGDNEVGHLAESDDRKLTELLKEVKDLDMNGLLGTGYDEGMLAALLMVTRPRSEVADANAAAEWVGMPEYDAGERPLTLVIYFRNDVDRQSFVSEKGIETLRAGDETNWTAWYPPKERDDKASVRFQG